MLHAVEWGSRRSNRVVICAHGYSGNGRDFDFLAQELSRDAHVICPDVAGRGRSAWLSGPFAYNFHQFLSDLRALILKVGAREIEWIGTSMGGLLGMLLASEPNSRIKRLVLNDVGAFIPGEALSAIGRHLRAPARFDTLAGVEQHLRHTHREWGPVTDAQWDHLVRHRSRRIADGYALHYDPAIAQIMRPLPLTTPLSMWSVWHRVRCPTLVIRGEKSQLLPPDVAHAMAAVKPDTRLVEIPGAGHAPSLMTSQQIGAVGEFLEDYHGDSCMSSSSATPRSSTAAERRDTRATLRFRAA